MRFSTRFILAILGLLVLAAPASAQLDELRRRAREVREAVRDIDSTVDEVSGAVKDVSAAASEVADAITPEPSAKSVAEDATRLSKECEARGATACVSMCTTVAQSINPQQTPLQDAQAIMKLCTNAHAAALSAPAAPTPAVAAAPPATTPATPRVPVPLSAEEHRAISAPYLEELARVSRQCDALPREDREGCQLYCASGADLIRNETDSARSVEVVAAEALRICRGATQPTKGAVGVAAPPPASSPTPEQAAREQQREAERRRTQEIELQVKSSTAESYTQKLNECEGLPADNGYKNACVAACRIAVANAANEPVGMLCLTHYDNAH